MAVASAAVTSACRAAAVRRRPRAALGATKPARALGPPPRQLGHEGGALRLDLEELLDAPGDRMVAFGLGELREAEVGIARAHAGLDARDLAPGGAQLAHEAGDLVDLARVLVQARGHEVLLE